MSAVDDSGRERGDDKTDRKVISQDEENRLREQIRSRLETELGRNTTSSESVADASTEEAHHATPERHLAERLAIIRREEDAFYAERGLVRYKNRRGEYEWLTKEEHDARVERRRRRGIKRQSSKGFIPRFSSSAVDRALGGVLTTALVIVILGATIAIFARSGDRQTGFVIDVRSEPVGAAVFINDEPANASTNAELHVEGPGTYIVTVALPGYRVRPESRTVHLVTEGDARVLSFSLYTQQDTMRHVGAEGISP